MPRGEVLRWAPPNRAHYRAEYREFPVMLALVQDIKTGAPMTIHFTYLQPDGAGKAPVPQARLLLPGHQKAGGAIRLDAPVRGKLALAEGIETALSVARWRRPVWSTIDAAGMKNFPLLYLVETLNIFADPDATGKVAAAACCDRWNESPVKNATAFIHSDGWKDFNDIVMDQFNERQRQRDAARKG